MNWGRVQSPPPTILTLDITFQNKPNGLVGSHEIKSRNVNKNVCKIGFVYILCCTVFQIFFNVLLKTSA